MRKSMELKGKRAQQANIQQKFIKTLLQMRNKRLQWVIYTACQGTRLDQNRNKLQPKITGARLNNFHVASIGRCFRGSSVGIERGNDGVGTPTGKKN